MQPLEVRTERIVAEPNWVLFDTPPLATSNAESRYSIESKRTSGKFPTPPYVINDVARKRLKFFAVLLTRCILIPEVEWIVTAIANSFHIP